MGNHHRTHQKAPLLKLSTKTQDVHIIGDAQIVADFILLYVKSADDYNYLDTVAQLHKHLQLRVGLESRQHSAGVIVIKELAAKLKVKLVSKFGNALFNVF